MDLANLFSKPEQGFKSTLKQQTRKAYDQSNERALTYAVASNQSPHLPCHACISAETLVVISGEVPKNICLGMHVAASKMN